MHTYKARCVLIIFLCVGLEFLLYSENLIDLVNPEIYSELTNTGSVKIVQLKNPQILSVPDNKDLRDLISLNYNDINPSMLIECYYVYEKPVRFPAPWTFREKTGLYNSIRAISSLTGIEYYSASRKKMRIFYEKSSVVDNPDSQISQKDPIVDFPEDRAIVYAKQTDLTFGENIYKYEYLSYDDMLIFSQTNLTTMKYGIMPLLGKNKLLTLVAIIDAENRLLVYSATMVKASLLPGIEGKVRDSFSNRADAIYGWFKASADRVFVR